MILSKYYIILGGQRVVNPRGSLVFPGFGEMMDGRYFLFSMPREGDVGAGRGGEVLRGFPLEAPKGWGRFLSNYLTFILKWV